MKYKKIFSVLFVTLFVLVQACFSQDNLDSKRDAYIQQIINELITQIHLQPATVDDAFSELAFNAYLKTLDYNKRLFTQLDIDTLSYYKYLIDNQLQEERFDFFRLSQNLVFERIKEAQVYYKKALEKPFNFDIDEYIQINADSLSWEKDKPSLEKRWYQMLKYETISRIYSDIEDQRKAMKTSDTIKEKSFAEIESNARESILKKYRNWFDIVGQWEHNDLFAFYINSLLANYDPHTEYFPPKDKEDFDIRFSGQLQGIGATLSQRDGYITVMDIVPGSPSWKQGELEVNDKILKVAQGNDEPIDIVDMRLDKAVKLIRGPKGTEARLTVQKIDGTQKTISIIRDLVIIEETYAKSMTITDKATGNKFGYIYLPSFYANFNNPAGRRCSKDMKAEVKKLTAENVKGIIIDLRNNSGGSLMDCIDITGLFISTGPVVQVQSSDNSHTYMDNNPDIQWDGPLVVMINQASASASEIFAAAMQDYQRAIIFGANSFGKGTVQRFEDLDPLVSANEDVKPLGALKVTLQNFYRINGGSTQLKGVAPDIPATTIYKYIDFGERELQHPLAWSEMKPAKYQLWKDGSCKWDPVIKNSLKRMEKDSFFIKMEINAKRLKKNRDNSIYPLKYEKYADYIDKLTKEADEFKDLGKDTLNMEAVILSTEPSIPGDTTVIERNNKWRSQILTDNMLYEALKVCGEMEKLPCFKRREEKK